MIRILTLITIVISLKIFSQKPVLLEQETIDTLRLVKENLTFEKDILFSIKKNKNIKAWTKYYVFKAFRCLVERKQDSALIYSNKAISEFHEKESDYLPSGGLIHKAYYIKGLKLFFKSQYISAIKSFNQGLLYIDKFPKSYDGKSWQSYIYGFLGESHYNVGDMELALFYKKKKLDDYRMGFKFYSTITYLGIGNLHATIGNIDSAKIYNHKALKIFKDSTIKHTGNERKETLNWNNIKCYNNLGEYHYREKNIDSALVYFKTAQKESLDKNLDYSKKSRANTKFFTKANYAYVLLNQDSLKKAEKILLNVLDSVNVFKEYSRENKRLYLHTHDYLRQVYTKSGNFKKIVDLDEKIIEYINNYNEKKISKHLQLLSLEFDTKTKENEIKSLSKAKKQNEVKIRNYQVIAIMLFVFMISLILFFLYYRKNKRKQEEYERANLKQQLMLMQMNPHFIFNAFSAINGKIVSESKNTTEYVRKLSYLFRNILRNSSQEYITLEEEVELLNNYLEVQSDFLDKFNFKINIDKTLDQESVLIPPMLMQPLLENSIVHGIKNDKGLIELNVKKNMEGKESLLVEVIDNGEGFIKKEIPSSMNLKKSYSIILIKDRLKLLSKKFNNTFELKYENDRVKGTCAKLSLPLVLDE